MKVLIDTNVILDVLLERHPFYKESFIIFQLADQECISGCLSATSITDIFYLLRKARQSYDEVYLIIDELTSLFSVIPVSDTTISSALKLRWKDFEDAVQFVVAKENNIECIITRNKADYQSSDIPCMSPVEFIDFFKEKDRINKE